VRQDLQDQARSPIWGWWGHAQPFAFDLDYRPAQGIHQFLVSSTPVFSTLSIELSIEMVQEAGIARLRSKSMAQTATWSPWRMPCSHRWVSRWARRATRSGAVRTSVCAILRATASTAP
jgi:hypothetical protein